MKWVSRERPKIDRLACPWLIRRFVDPQAEIHTWCRSLGGTHHGWQPRAILKEMGR